MASANCCGSPICFDGIRFALVLKDVVFDVPDWFCTVSLSAWLRRHAIRTETNRSAGPTWHLKSSFSVRMGHDLRCRHLVREDEILRRSSIHRQGWFLWNLFPCFCAWYYVQKGDKTCGVFDSQSGLESVTSHVCSCAWLQGYAIYGLGCFLYNDRLRVCGYELEHPCAL